LGEHDGGERRPGVLGERKTGGATKKNQEKTLRMVGENNSRTHKKRGIKEALGLGRGTAGAQRKRKSKGPDGLNGVRKGKKRKSLTGQSQKIGESSAGRVRPTPLRVSDAGGQGLAAKKKKHIEVLNLPNLGAIRFQRYARRTATTFFIRNMR